MKRQSPRVKNWERVEVPHRLGPPRPLLVRIESLPPRSYFAEHHHDWNQLVYASSGVLTVNAENSSLAISPEQAVWLPTGTRHWVGSLMGAEFRSLWVVDDPSLGLPSATTVFNVPPLLRALIIEAAALHEARRDCYAERVTALIFDQLLRTQRVDSALPWPRNSALLAVCEALYADPCDPRGLEDWATELRMSGRTLARRFDQEVGMSMRAWRRRLRLFKAIELLGGGLGVTQTALDLGYASASAFIYMFRQEMGCTPQHYRRMLRTRS
jgi:AraC-like DNA-binding protein